MKKVWRRVLSSVLTLSMVLGSFSLSGVTAKAEDEVERVNYALNASVSANDVEEGCESFWGADKAVDGIVNRDETTKTSQSRWSTNKDTSIGEKVLTVDLGEEKTFEEFVIEWERTNVQGFSIQVSSDGDAYETVYAKTTSTNVTVTTKVTLETPATGRYVKLVVDTYDGGDLSWESISVYEFEIYNVAEVIDDTQVTLDSYVANLTAPEVEEGADKWELPATPEGITIELIGADYEQIIDDDLTIYQPLVDTTVSVNYRVSDGEETVETSAYEVAVPGKYEVEEGDNAKPVVIPEMAEWKGHTGEFAVTEDSEVLYNAAYAEELAFTVESFAADYEDLTGDAIAVRALEADEEPAAGDFYFTLGSADAGLKEEGYIMTVGDYVTVEACEATGAYWAVQSIMQILKQTEGTIAKGIARDYPKYEVRGFMLDVGRKTFELDYLYDTMKQMAYYKMNDFQIHLNDNYIFLEEYTNAGEDPMTAYSGFRLESDVKEGGNNGLNKADLTSKDVFYTKDEFRTLIQTARQMGIDVVPEFDTPAHSLAFTKVRPDLKLGDNGRQNDHFDITTEESLAASEEFIFSIWDEYLDGEDPVFDMDTIVNVGTDEYSGYNEQFRQMTDDLLAYVQSKGRTVRLWGSLTTKSGTTEVRSENVQMNIWNSGWANPAAMYKEGYGLINMLDGTLYIVPAAGYYYDYLNSTYLYNSWQPNVMAGTTIPAGSDQMLGSAYAIWNDMIDKRANGLSEYDIFDRFDAALPAMSSKLWGDGEDLTYDELAATAEVLGTAPNCNPYSEVESRTEKVVEYTFDNETNVMKDTSGNKYHGAEGKNIGTVEGYEGNALHLDGGESYQTTALENIGPNAEVSFWVKADADAEGEQILFDDGHTQVKMSQVETGKVGFSREGYDYSFEYELPKDEWVYLTFKTYQNSTELYVNGELTDTLGKNLTGDLYATLVFPLETIGSTTNAFKGAIDELTVVKAVVVDDSATRIPSDGFTVTCDNQYGGTTTEGVIDLAFDGNEDTIWHSNYSPYQALPATVEIDMGQSYVIDQFDYLPRQDGSENGRITKYELYGKLNADDEYTLISEGTWASSTDIKKVYFAPTEYQYLKFVAVEGDTNSGNMFASAAEFYIHEYDPKADLKAVYGSAGAFEEEDSVFFTEESWNAFIEAKDAALAVIEKEDATAEEIAAATEALQAAIDNLEVKEDDGKVDENPAFEDVAEDSYYIDAILWALENGVTEGTEGTAYEPGAKFSPETTCTRGQVVTFLYRAAGEPEYAETACKFTDVQASDYYYDAVLWAVEKGITDGTAADKFSPNDPCTRGQVVTFLYRAAGEPTPETTENVFTDITVKDYYYNAILWAKENGITDGISDTQFGPSDPCTRGQVVTFLWRAE